MPKKRSGLGGARVHEAWRKAVGGAASGKAKVPAGWKRTGQQRQEEGWTWDSKRGSLAKKEERRPHEGKAKTKLRRRRRGPPARGRALKEPVLYGND